MKAFHLYQYCGGDIEEAFNDFNDQEAGEHILRCIEMICKYKLIKLIFVNYNDLFANSFKANFTSGLIGTIEPKSVYSKSYFKKCFREMMHSITSKEDVSKETPKVLFGINPSASDIDNDESFIHAFAAGEWLDLIATKKSIENSEIRLAHEEWREKLVNLCAFGLRGF